MAKSLLFLLWAGAITVCVCFLVWYYSPDNQRYLAWSEKRAAWHRDCGYGYVVMRDHPNGVPFDPAGRRACGEDLAKLLADAKRHGWAWAR